MRYRIKEVIDRDKRVEYFIQYSQFPLIWFTVETSYCGLYTTPKSFYSLEKAKACIAELVRLDKRPKEKVRYQSVDIGK